MSKEKKDLSSLDILKKINKVYEHDVDKLKLASDVSEDYFKTILSSSGSDYLDSILGGGWVCGALNIIVGQEGSGKSSLTLLAVKELQKKTGKKVVYFDAESSVSNSYLNRFGIDRELLIHVKNRNLEKILDMAQMFSTASDIGGIVFDSIPVFVATAVQQKSAEDHNMAVEARKWTERFAVIEANCIARKIAIFGLTFYTKDPGVQRGDNRVMKRGEWQKLAAHQILQLSKKKIIKDEEGNPIGHQIQVKHKKSKVTAYDPLKEFMINFYYDSGFDNVRDSVEILVEKGIIEKAGGWFKFPDINGEEQKIQGKASLTEFMRSNSEIFEYLKNQEILV